MDDKLKPIGHEEIPIEIRVGQWFWLDSTDYRGETYRWLGCVVHVGSNYVELKGVHNSGERIHMDEWMSRCEPELDAYGYIKGQIRTIQGNVQRLLAEVNEITTRLSVSSTPELPDSSDTQALATQSRDPGEYKKELVKAKDKDLPELFKRIDKENELLAKWMKATTIPLLAEADKMRGSIKIIENRVFAVELYAGLTEEIEQISDGEPAGMGDKLHLMQRRCYMDEECLANYESGGMEFSHIREFDAWLAKEENRDRILPFPRCMVAFQVRRKRKEREAVKLLDFISIYSMEQADKATFLYIRNGELLYRLSTDIEFEEKLFPDLDRSKLTGQKLWANVRFTSRIHLLTDNEYQDQMREYKEQRVIYEKKRSEWEKEQEGLKSGDEGYDPFGPRGPDGDIKEYEPFDDTNVYYDDISKHIKGELDKHNRIALIVQGLFDRSTVLHPHPKVKMWTADGFDAAIELVYDDSRALHADEKPDFEAYRAKLNEELRDGSVTVGQEDAWELLEGERESSRMDRSWCERSDWRPERFRPYGNPGPGLLARVHKFAKRAKKCTFRWERERRSYPRHSWDRSGPVPATFTCPASKLLNVDAYKPGDFRQFFDDPRTRAEYLQWAPLLLAAEDYHAGKRKAGDPG